MTQDFAHPKMLIPGWVSILCIIGFALLAIIALLMAGTGFDPVGIFSDAYLLRVFRFTVIQAALSTLLSIGFAIPATVAMARQPRFPGRIWIIRLLAVPMGLPVLIGALGLIGVWGRQGFVNSLLLSTGLFQTPVSIYGLSGILMAHVFFNLPLACRMMLAGLERAPAEYWLMAESLRMRSWAVFRFIEWPLIRPLLPGVAGLIFMLCATSFTLVLMLGGGPAATTIEVAIYQSLRFDFDPGRAVSLSLLQILLTLLILGVLAFLTKPVDQGVLSGRASARPDGAHITTRLWDGAVITVMMMFVALPLCAMVIAGAKADFARLLRETIVYRAAATSLILAFSSASICLILSLTLMAARHAIDLESPVKRSKRVVAGIMGAASSVVLLVPPLVLATGWFLMLRRFGDPADYAFALITIINALMALPFVMRVLEPAFQVHRQRTRRLATSLGMSGWSQLRWVDWPGLRRPGLTAFSFAMALSLGDLGAIALFGSDRFISLPWLIYSRMGSYRTSDADGLALLLGLVCLGLTLAGTTTMKEQDPR